MQRASGDAIVNLIEQIFWERQKIWMAVYERKNGTGICTFTGGEGSGHCRVPDPTAAQAIRNAIELETVTLEDGHRILWPERWLRVFDAVKDFCEDDPVDKEIFARRYQRGERNVPVTIEQSVYSRHLLKIRNHAKMCAAQEQLVRIF